MKNKDLNMDWTIRELNELIENLGGEEPARKIQRGEAKVNLEDILRVFFDKHGRRIPEGLQSNVCNANLEFRLYQPAMTKNFYIARLERLHKYLGIDTGVTAEQFKQETERLLALIRDNFQIANIINGVWLPVILPQLTTDNLGETLEQYLEAVGKSYVKTFSDRKFYNHRKGILAGEVNIIDGSRHGQLIKQMKQRSVIGIHFPNPLQGFSVNASREQMATLPKGFILSGIDTVIAMAMYPDILARDCNTPGLDLAALSWRSAGSSLYFKARSDDLNFVTDLDCLARAHAFYSGGLLFISPEEED